jgi:hypothetical protein
MLIDRVHDNHRVELLSFPVASMMAVMMSSVVSPQCGVHLFVSSQVKSVKELLEVFISVLEQMVTHDLLYEVLSDSLLHS